LCTVLLSGLISRKVMKMFGSLVSRRPRENREGYTGLYRSGMKGETIKKTISVRISAARKS